MPNGLTWAISIVIILNIMIGQRFFSFRFFTNAARAVLAQEVRSG